MRAYPAALVKAFAPWALLPRNNSIPVKPRAAVFQQPSARQNNVLTLSPKSHDFVEQEKDCGFLKFSRIFERNPARGNRFFAARRQTYGLPVGFPPTALKKTKSTAHVAEFDLNPFLQAFYHIMLSGLFFQQPAFLFPYSTEVCHERYFPKN